MVFEKFIRIDVFERDLPGYFSCSIQAYQIFFKAE